MTLQALVDRDAHLTVITAHLEALDSATRIAEVRAMTRRDQEKLWSLAKDQGEINLDVFVNGQRATIIYEGKNTVPVFSRFQKRFYRSASEIAGYNHNGPFVTFWSGPGYFLASARDGELVFDYSKKPSEVPPGWPSMSGGVISGIVFGDMIDYCRFVSKDTVIGAAFLHGKPRNQYFMLTR